MEQEGKPASVVAAVREKVRRSVTAKLVVIGVVLLLCRIPAAMVSALRSERSGRAASVEAEVASKWGGAQRITGPLISLSVSRQKEVERSKQTRTVTEYSTFNIAPEKLHVKGTLTPEIRYRGIYEVILYRSELTLSGVFPANRKGPAGRGWQMTPNCAELVLGISDIKGICDIEVRIDGKVCKADPGFLKGRSPASGIVVPLPQLAAKDPGRPVTFDIKLKLNGCRSLLVYPVGRTTGIELVSSWPGPSFSGGFLPEKRTITPEGFTASWIVNEFNRDCPASWLGNIPFTADQCAGVDLLRAVNPYALTGRAISYDVLIFVIVMVSLLIAEKLSGRWVHPLQYLVAALSLLLFYSVLLALSEHISFNVSYAVSTAAVAALGGFYARLIFGSMKAAAGMAAVTVLSYGVIFVILRLEDYALLAGSGVLVVLMAVLMALTGRLNQRNG